MVWCGPALSGDLDDFIEGSAMLFLLLIIVVGFFALRWLGQRFFTGQYRADVFALVVVVAFVAGALVPFGHRPGSPEPAPAPAAVVAPPVAPAPSVAAAVPPPHDVRTVCQAVKKLTGAGFGNIDGVGMVKDGRTISQAAGFHLNRSALLGVQGWAADGTAKVPGEGACLVIDGTLRADATSFYGNLRPDVAAASKLPAMTAVGYVITLPATALKPGTHLVRVASVTSAGAALLSVSFKFVTP
jgi:hypothetical protein